MQLAVHMTVHLVVQQLAMQLRCWGVDVRFVFSRSIAEGLGIFVVHSPKLLLLSPFFVVIIPEILQKLAAGRAAG